MAHLLAALAQTFNVNLGFETDPLQPRRHVMIDAAEATLEDTLNAVVKAAPNYQWRSHEGFVDVYPRNAASPFLDTVVVQFQAHGNDWVTASDVLLSLPDVRERMGLLRLSRSELSNIPRGTPFELKLEHVTVRRALHEIAKHSDNSFWIFQRSGNQSQSFLISNTPP